MEIDGLKINDPPVDAVAALSHIIIYLVVQVTLSDGRHTLLKFIFYFL